MQPSAGRLLYGLIAGLLIAVSVGDILVPLGVAVWIFYLAPLVLSLLSYRPFAPLVVAFVGSAFIVATYFVAPAPEVPDVRALAVVNRLFGVITLLTVGFVGRQSVRNKLRLTLQEWMKAGQNGLSLRMQGEQRIDELGRNVLSYLSEYVGVLVGCVYVQNGNGMLKRQAAFAGRAEMDGGNHSIALGEGLVGQAAAEGRVMIVDRVPNDYIEVRSGLGAAPPNTLVLVPTRADGQVNGVIELGFFSPPVEAVHELLGFVADPIGIAFRSAKYRARQAELLEHTQRQTEELQLQQEELRAANDELEAQGRRLKTSAIELEQQHAELRQTNAQLEAQKQELLSTQLLLKDKLVELERASRYKSEFLANMSHELRTPLNSSLILARLLAENREANLTGEQVKYAENIYAAGNDLLTLIDDVLDLSKIEAAKVEIDVRDISIARLFEDLRSRFEPLAAEKRLELSLAIDPNCPPNIESDRQRLQQILSNLLSNAVKFTETGSVRLRAAARDGGSVGFEVEDTGIGIALEQHDVIFEAFRQADGTTNRKYGGTGLGLSISRELAGLLGGEIRLESCPDRGSVFTLVLPRQYQRSTRGSSARGPRPVAPPDGYAAPLPAPRSALPAPPEVAHETGIEDDRVGLDRQSKVLLLIEDDATFAKVLLDLAHQLSFRCLVAASADEGIRLARNHQPWAIILDIGLPDQSGLTVIELLKRDPATRHVPIHVVSAHDYQRVARSMGAVGYALKPVKREQLIEAMRLVEEQHSRKSRSILVVDDEEVQLGAIGQLLAGDGITIVKAASAETALEHLRGSTFDCVVLDLMLPGLNGFDLLDKIAADEHCSFPPVIVYTARKLTFEEEHRLRRLARSIIVKGARSPERLLEEVTLFLHQVEAELPTDKQRMLQAAREREEAFVGCRILLVEDDIRSVFALSSVLERKGASIEIARNGRAALERLEREPPIDVVLMDVMMPEMDGLSATREIRQNASWSELPIIALTAKAMPDDRQRCLRAGANDYIAKPVDIEKLLSLLRVWIPA